MQTPARHQTNRVIARACMGLLMTITTLSNCSGAEPDNAAGGPAVAVRINDLGDHQVVQRSIGTAQGPVKISGSFSVQADITVWRIQAQVVNFTTGAVVLDWQDVQYVPTGFATNEFSGIINVPQGSWYRLAVRALGLMPSKYNVELARTSGTNPWGVGMNILCIGQSNMVGNGDIHSYHKLDRDMAGLYSNDKRWKQFADPYDGGGSKTDVDYDTWIGASMTPLLLNSLAKTFPEIPIGIVPAAKGSTAIHGTQKTDWIYRDEADHANPDNLYGNSIAKAKAAGGVELIIMHQGETDATRGLSAEQYRADLRTLLARYREDLYPAVPLFICQLARSFTTDRNRTDATLQEIRKAQWESDDPPNVYLAALCIDLAVRPNDDHYFQDAYDTIGARIGNSIAYHYKKSPYFRGPSIASAKIGADRASIDVSIAHRGGNDLTPELGITGFEVLGSSGALPIASVTKVDATTIRIKLADAPPAGSIVLKYLNGKSPNITGAVHDNSPLRLPLEPTATPVPVTGAGE
jgi:hypothetical protein